MGVERGGGAVVLGGELCVEDAAVGLRQLQERGGLGFGVEELFN